MGSTKDPLFSLVCQNIEASEIKSNSSSWTKRDTSPERCVAFLSGENFFGGGLSIECVTPKWC